MSIKDYTAEQALWDEYRSACFRYEDEPTAKNWLAKQAALMAWTVEYLRDAA